MSAEGRRKRKLGLSRKSFGNLTRSSGTQGRRKNALEQVRRNWTLPDMINILSEGSHAACDLQAAREAPPPSDLRCPKLLTLFWLASGALAPFDLRDWGSGCH
ncbi:hypothetical protein Avi_9536 (plasmid) [Allorhizobium ampelinum S4]|uniref:Uncharacterized protein n=1 Tax=Allorhizobium ampelinum (strain ATCC BAA-846 / DSM 112012 / S4) TaxID=311402 RepID=B9K338_ALLAM|nr:hypothetical protein Avi_9536 [Allorhizobium ampelinum S4]